MSITRSISRRTFVVAAAAALVMSAPFAYAQAKKPNVVDSRDRRHDRRRRRDGHAVCATSPAP